MNKLMKKLSTLIVGFAMAVGVGAAIGSNVNVGGVSAAAGTDKIVAKGFAGYTNNSFSAVGTDYTAVANVNNSNISGVTYALQIFNGSTGAVRGNQSSAKNNFSARNTTTQSGFYISQIKLTVSGGTLDGSTNGRSVVYFGTSAFSNPNVTAPSGTATKPSPASSGQSSLTWTNTDTSKNYFILYNLKTSGTALSAGSPNFLEITWTKSITEYKVSYNANGGSGSHADDTYSGTPITLPSDGFSKEHYTFDGWATSPTGAKAYDKGASYTPTGNVTLYAHYSLAEYSVTLSKGTGDGPADTTIYVSIGQSTTLPDSGYSKAHYTFDGWATSSTGAKAYDKGASYTPTGNVTLYAHYTVSEYVITYNANSGSGSHANDVVTKGQSVALPDSGFSKTGYTFDGWATTSSGAKAYDLGASYTPTANVILYAHYTILSFTITPTYINCEGGNEPGDSIEYGGNLYDYIEPNTGYHLPSEVAVSVNGESEPRMVSINEDSELKSANITGNVTYTVEAIINSYSVTGNIANGLLTGDSNVNHGSPYSGKIEANTDFHLPDSISVTIDGSSLSISNFTYSAETGDIEIAGEYVLGDIEIIGTCYMVYAIDASCGVGGSVDYAKSNSNIRSGGTANIYFVASPGYILPPDSSEEYFEIENAEINNYNPETGCLTIKNPTGTVSIVCNCVELGYRDITLIMDNVTSTGTGEDAIEIGGSATVTIEANTGYRLPSESDFEVVGADAAFAFADNKNVTITLTNCISDVTITATCVQQFEVSVSVTNGSATKTHDVLDTGSSFSTTLSPNDDYKLPDTISVTIGGREAQVGTDYIYNSSTGAVNVTSITGTTLISAAMVALIDYDVTVNLTNVTKVSGPDTIQERGSAKYVFSADDTKGYYLPDSVTVINAGSTWTKSSGTLVISNPTGDVSISVVADKDELTSITLSPSSGTYTLGDNFNMPTVTAHYKYKGNADVTSSATFTGYDPFTTGTQTVEISYTEDGVTKKANYTATVKAKSIQTDTIWTRITSVAELTAGTYIIGYEATAGSNTIVPLRSGDYATTLTKNGIFNTGTTAGSSTGETITIATNMSSTDYEFTIEVISAGVINIKGSDGNYLGTSNDGGSKNTGRIYDSGNSNETNFSLEYNKNKFSMTASNVSGQYKYLTYNTNSPRYACYNTKSNDTSFYKKSTQSTGTASLIRIVCDPQIDPATGYKGGDKYIGDKVSISDFVVKKQLDTGNPLTSITNFTINGGTEVTLTDTSNTITISYTENSITKTCDVVVTAEERTAEVTSVKLVQGEHVVKKYIDHSAAAWDFTDLTVECKWTDSSFDETFDLADLVESGDATISPSKPSEGVTSFTVSYTYHEKPITDNTVTGITVIEDYVTAISWTGTSAAQFKKFSGDYLTEEIVNSWVVVPTFAGAGEGKQLSFNDYTLKVGEKTISSLPYEWETEDDGQALTITYGLKEDGTPFVKSNSTAKGNICARIDAIDHDETTTGDQSIDLDVANATFNPSGTSGTGSTAKTEINGFTITTDKGYHDASNHLRVYSGGNFEISSNYTINSVSYTFSESKYNGLSGGTGLSTKNFTEKASKQARITSIHIDYKGTTTVTTHYANQIEHFDAQKAVVEFAKYVNTTMNSENVCSGTKENLGTAWTAISSKYTELFGSESSLSSTELAWAKNMLKYVTTNDVLWKSDEEMACVEKAMSTYVFCVKHYPDTCNPFMKDVRPVEALHTTSLLNVMSENPSVVIISVITLVGASSIGGYFYIRRRKETN